MAECRDVIHRLKAGHSVRDIHRSTGVHRTIIRQLRELASERGWLSGEAQLPSELELERIRKVGQEATSSPALADRFDRHRDDFKRWVDEGLSYVVMHQLIGEQVPCSLSSVMRYVKREFPPAVDVVMRRDTVAGEVMEVDFGYLGVTFDPDSGRNRRTWVFSGRLRHSRRAWRERCFDQKQQTFFSAHIHAFEHFGGVVARVTPDNLKAAVVRASFEDPIINRSYRALAGHYGFLIDPCGPYQPRHKGGVESDIKYIKRNFWPMFREQQRQRGRDKPWADDLEHELARWSTEVADRRTIGGVGRSPQQIFAAEEAAVLRALPGKRWDPLSWGECNVGPDWRIQFDKRFYSVPYRYVGRQVVVYANSQQVRIYLGHEEIALHRRVETEWDKSIKDEHAPPHQQQWLSVDRNGLLRWAYRLGEPVGTLAGTILADKAVDGMRPVRALIRLADSYSPERLAAACRRALLYETPYYRSVKAILAKGLDQLPLAQPAQPNGQLAFRFQREHGYFDPARNAG